MTGPNVSAFNPGVTGSVSQGEMLAQSFLTDNEQSMNRTNMSDQQQFYENYMNQIN